MTATTWPSAILDVLQRMYEIDGASKAEIAAVMTELRGRPTTESAVDKRATIIGLHRSPEYMRAVYVANGAKTVPTTPREHRVALSERAAIAKLLERPEVRDNPVRRVSRGAFPVPEGGFSLFRRVG